MADSRFIFPECIKHCCALLLLLLYLHLLLILLNLPRQRGIPETMGSGRMLMLLWVSEAPGLLDPPDPWLVMDGDVRTRTHSHGLQIAQSRSYLYTFGPKVGNIYILGTYILGALGIYIHRYVEPDSSQSSRDPGSISYPFVRPPESGLGYWVESPIWVSGGTGRRPDQGK